MKFSARVRVANDPFQKLKDAPDLGPINSHSLVPMIKDARRAITDSHPDAPREEVLHMFRTGLAEALTSLLNRDNLTAPEMSEIHKMIVFTGDEELADRVEHLYYKKQNDLLKDPSRLTVPDYRHLYERSVALPEHRERLEGFKDRTKEGHTSKVLEILQKDVESGIITIRKLAEDFTKFPYESHSMLNDKLRAIFSKLMDAKVVVESPKDFQYIGRVYWWINEKMPGINSEKIESFNGKIKGAIEDCAKRMTLDELRHYRDTINEIDDELFSKIIRGKHFKDSDKLPDEHEYVPGTDDITWLRGVLKSDPDFKGKDEVSWVEFKKKYKNMEQNPHVKSIFNGKIGGFKAGSASIAKVDVYLKQHNEKDSPDKKKFPITYDEWSGAQKKMYDHNQIVIQLNTPPEMIKEFNDKRMENFLVDVSATTGKIHPINPEAKTIGWARVYPMTTRKGKKWVIEEVQSDLDNFLAALKKDIDPVGGADTEENRSLPDILNQEGKSGQHYTPELVRELGKKFHHIFANFEKWLMPAVLEAARKNGVEDIYMYTKEMVGHISSDSKRIRFYDALPKEFRFKKEQVYFNGQNETMWHRKAYQSKQAILVDYLANELEDL